jgi:signal transduction histidine kinase
MNSVAESATIPPTVLDVHPSQLRRSDGGDPARAAVDAALSWIAHELRAPIMDAHLLLAHGALPDEPGSAHIAAHVSSQLATLYDDLHDILRWGAGHEVDREAEVDLFQLSAGICGASEDGRIRLRQARGLDARVRGDAAGLRTAVRNLVKNALAYSPPGEPIEVVVAGGSGWVRVTVRDRGPGIAPCDVDSIFGAFARGSAGDVAGGGHGLGLYICRCIVEAHEGHLSLEPTDRGASFTISLPAGSMP